MSEKLLETFFESVTNELIAFFEPLYLLISSANVTLENEQLIRSQVLFSSLTLIKKNPQQDDFRLSPLYSYVMSQKI